MRPISLSNTATPTQALISFVNHNMIVAREAAFVEVDSLVMAVTEGLCLLEEQNSSFMALPENRALKAQLLAGLDELDRLMGAFRTKTNDLGGIDGLLRTNSSGAGT